MAEVDANRAYNLAQYKLLTHDRPLQLALAGSRDVRDDVLLPQRVIGKESICGGFEYRILCLADDAGLALKDFMACLPNCASLPIGDICGAFPALLPRLHPGRAMALSRPINWYYAMPCR